MRGIIRDPDIRRFRDFFFRLPFYFFNQAEEIEERGINWFDSRWRWISTPRAWPDIIL